MEYLLLYHGPVICVLEHVFLLEKQVLPLLSFLVVS